MSYRRFALTLLVSLGLMFVATLSLIRTLDHFILNLSNFYMALIMVAAMGIAMLVLMWGMFRDPRLNVALVAALGIALVGSLYLGRTSALIGDRQFLESMIPHHSRAILLCQEASLSDPEILALCDQIVASQQQEIDQMQQILERY
jgi:hypothetical protein